MNLFQLIFLAIIVLSIIEAIKRFRAKTINPVMLSFFILIWTLGAIIILIPNVSSVIANFLGISRGADVIIYISIIVIVFIQYRLYLKLEETNQKLKQISTKIALTQKKPRRQ